MIHLESKRWRNDYSKLKLDYLYTHEKTVELNRFCSEVDVGRVNRGTDNEPSFFNEKW